MRNITFSADESAIEQARRLAQSRSTTLNEEFRKWLAAYTDRRRLVERERELATEMGTINFGGRKFTRDEMNERR